MKKYPAESLRLPCGIELAVMPIPGRAIAAMEIRLLAGYAYEDERFLGLAHVLAETISKGTAHFDARELSDAFDAIGASHGEFTGRETFGFSCLCLPEFLPRAIELHAEMILTPTFPTESCETAVELSRQSLAALKDDPQDLTRKYLHRQAYGHPLGRHILGEEETLACIGREQIVAHWRRYFSSARMQIAIAGAVDTAYVADLFARQFEKMTGSAGADALPTGFPLRFSPGCLHVEKELEQEQIAICFPGCGVIDPEFYAEQVAIAVLGGSMSSRLFTEVREKQGLVYWVGASADQPRRGGMVHVGASSTPENVDKTYQTLLREVDRLADDVTAKEVERAIIGIVGRAQTQGDVTRSRAGELVNDLFYYGYPVPLEEKLSRIQAVTTDDVQRYLATHKRDQLSVVTLGPKPFGVTKE